ncbi:MAG: hypothetical protein WDW38_007265 [Sanguina aurantia]
MMMKQRIATTGLSSRASTRQVSAKATRGAAWFPGNKAPAHLDGSLPGDFGFDPLGLGVDPEQLKWFREAELQHSRWAMAAVAGILVQEVAKPETFWYSAASTVELPFPIVGIVAFQILTMQWVELRRWQDFKKPGSVDQDPVFANQKLPPHEPGYPGGLKVKEIKNGRLAMLAFVGFVMGAQVTGLGPIAALNEHIAAPFDTTIFSKALVIPGQSIVPACAIPPSVVFQGVTIPTPCFLAPLWP